MSKYEYRSAFFKESDYTDGKPLTGDFIKRIQIFDIERILNNWGNLNWELIKLDYDLSTNTVYSYNFGLNFFFFFKRELNEDLTPNKNNRFEYRVIYEDIHDNRLNDQQQDLYFNQWIKEGFEIVDTLLIRKPMDGNYSTGVFPTRCVLYVFKRQIDK